MKWQMKGDGEQILVVRVKHVHNNLNGKQQGARIKKRI